jgi:hypothetical protein
MKHLLRSTLAATALLFASLNARAAAPGYVDLGQFKAAAGREFVEVNLHTPLLKFAAMFVDKDDADVAQLLRSIKQVHVNVVGYDDTNRSETTAHVQKLRHDLESQGWSQMVTVQGQEDQDIAIFVKMADDDSIDGLVVTVIDRGEKHAVVVNVIGNIKPEQLAAIGKGLHIDPLAQMELHGHMTRA